jgi:AcrR family transcriptional regulator
MPPKIKVTEEAILDAALELTRDKGIASVNARDVAKMLGCSIQPVFRNFQSMDNLKKDLYKKAENIYDDYINRGMVGHSIPFLGLGMAYIDFAKKEKNLFKLLFMSDEFKGRSIIGMIKDEENQSIVEMVSRMTGLCRDKAEQLFMDIWLLTHGIASLVATNDLEVSEEKISKILKDSFLGIKYQLSMEDDKQ